MAFALAALMPSDLSSLILTILFILIVYYVYRAIAWYRSILAIGKVINQLPGDKQHWLLGTLEKHPGISHAGLLFMLDMCERYGDRAFRQWFGPFRPTVMFHHPATLKLILKTAEPKGMGGNGPYKLIYPWLGDGLLVAGGAKWQRNRKLLTPAFHFDILKPYMQINNEAVEILMDKWEKMIKANPDESIEISSHISLCTLDIIMRCAFSYNADIQTSKEENHYVNAIMSLSQLVSDRAFNIVMYLDWIYYRTSNGRKFVKACEYVHKFAEDVMEKRKKTLKDKGDETKSKRLDFLDIILLAKDETGVGLTDLEIRNEVDTFMFEGHDTTSSAMTSILYNLATHPEIQQKAYEEVKSLLDNRESPFVTWDDVGNELQYVTMCIKESLRSHPPVPFIIRDLANPLEVDGVNLPPGSILVIAIWMAHHNRVVWGDDHMEYKPERFDPENLKTMEPHAFIPFSAGPRNCIGQVFAMHELKVLTARIIHRFQLELDENHEVEFVPELVLRAKHGVKLKMKRRI